MVTVPSCHTCNTAFARDEEYVRNWIACAFRGDRSSVGYQVLSTQVMKSVTRGEARMLKMLTKNMHLEDVYSEGGVYLGRAPLLTIDRPRFLRVVEKTTRGLFFHETGRCLSSDAYVQVVISPNSKLIKSNQVQFLASMPQKGNHPEVFRYKVAFVNDDPDGSVWLMQFYESIMFLSVTYGADSLKSILALVHAPE